MFPTFTSLLISVTEACHVGCSHCGFIGSTREREAEPEEMALWISQACSYGIPKMIFTGGEPFERLEVLAGGVRAGLAFGVEIGVFTSSYWGDSRERAKKTLSYVKGVTHLYLSSDTFHQRRVPYQYVFNVIEAANDVGVKNISICITYRDEGELALVKQQYARYGERLLFHADQVIPTQFQNTAIRETCRLPLSAKTDHYSCQCYLGTPIVNPNGDLISCHAGKAGAHADLRHLPYYLGNLRMNSFEEIMQTVRLRRDYQFLRTHGPKGVAQLFSISPNLTAELKRDRFSNCCDMCFAVLRTQAGRDALRTLLDDASIQEDIDLRLLFAFGDPPLADADGLDKTFAPSVLNPNGHLQGDK